MHFQFLKHLFVQVRLEPRIKRDQSVIVGSVVQRAECDAVVRLIGAIRMFCRQYMSSIKES